MIDVAIIGPTGGTHVASSLARGARDAGLHCATIETDAAFGTGPLQRLAWHLFDKYPLRLRPFLAGVKDRIATDRPKVLLVLGGAPMTGADLRAIGAGGVRCAHFSTDDPFNPRNGSRRLRASLPVYDVVFTPRRSTIEDLAQLGCADVRYMPFAFDPALFHPPHEPGPLGPDVLFVGGGDADRAAFFTDFLRHGPPPALVGGLWDRYPALRPYWLGTKAPQDLQRLTAQAAVNICLVRRANRDGHVMRSFEIPAIGGFMLAEDTQEHRDLFGPDGACLRYFSGPEEAGRLAHWALAHPQERVRMARALHDRITRGGHTYGDRIKTILAALA
ncbi:CgeB family protein [Aquabacter spiritensis]|uniref:Uncharacterized protein DUF3880 n=1 Tax=Aquabacter spiritensis TaxID=933073 RepID=A0A4R3LJT9_9HYPH|nr:glycosyltransferase [Aquabacter spiritensis]TCT00540.1 uncharacterized protein DUF3880 [Aquabacter spiritensis]